MVFTADMERRRKAFERKTRALRNKNIHVVGIAGTEGSAVLEFLVEKVGCKKVTAHEQHERKEFVKWFRKAHIGLSDEESRAAAERVLGFRQVTSCFGSDYLKGVEKADIVFVPQSWTLYEQVNRPLFGLATDKLSGMMRLYFDLWPGKMIGVTGSNGKTTTANMIFSVLTAAHSSDDGFGQVYFSGNDRRSEQVLNVLDSVGTEDWLVLEISNRHLKMDLGRSPDIGVLTNISPNHLTEYEGFDEYKACKDSLLKYQTREQVAVLNVDDVECRHLIEREEKAWVGFSLSQFLTRGAFVDAGRLVVRLGDRVERICKVDEILLKGQHNVANALAVSLVAFLAHVPVDVIGQSLRGFEAVPQRLELVRDVAGIEFYNDSASTTPESTMAGLNSFDEGMVVLVMGGVSKGSDYSELAKLMVDRAKAVVFLRSDLAKEIGGLLRGLRMVEVDTMKDAVQMAFDLAEAGDKVVLSPAGDFGGCRNTVKDYLKFRHWVRKLKTKS